MCGGRENILNVDLNLKRIYIPFRAYIYLLMLTKRLKGGVLGACPADDLGESHNTPWYTWLTDPKSVH